MIHSNKLLLIINQISLPIINLVLAIIVSGLGSNNDKNEYALFVTMLSISIVIYGFNSKVIVQNKGNNSYDERVDNAKLINLIFGLILILSTLIFFREKILITLAIVFFCISELTIEYFRYNLNQKKLIFCRFIKSIIDVCLFIILITYQDPTTSRMISIIASSLLAIIFFVKNTIPNIENIKLSLIVNVISYTFPMLIYSSSIILASMIDRFILSANKMDDLYTYFLMSSFANGNIMLTTAIMPIVVNKIINNKFKNKNKDIINWIVFIILISIIIFFVIYIMRNSNIVYLSDNWSLIYLLLSLSTIIQIPYFFNVQKGIAYGKTNVMIIIGLISLIVNVSLNLLMIPLYGPIGATIASIISSFTITICSVKLCSYT